jgi:cytochrome c oxidase subunit I
MKIKRLFSVFALLLFIYLLPQMLIWIHHRFVFGLNPFVGPIILIFIFLILFLILFKWIKWLNKHWFRENNNEPIALFALGGVCFIISCAITGNKFVEINSGNRTFLFSYFNLILDISFVFGIFCLIYYIFPKILRRGLDMKLSRYHFWITYIGLNLYFGINLLGSRFADKIINEPYNYFDKTLSASYNPVKYFNELVVILVILILIAQVLFLVNIIYSLTNKRKSIHV